MKLFVNNLLDWFEKRFNFLIELIALIGGVFCILFAIIVFFLMILDFNGFSNLAISAIILPGLLGFAGVFILFALRITRYIAKLSDNKE